MNIAQQVRQIIIQATNMKVSDIHFHPQDERVAVYYRIHNKLIYQNELNLDIYLKYIRYLKFQTRLDISVTRFPQDGSFTVLGEDEEKIFVRISTIPLIENESLVIRILPDITYTSFKEISYFADDLENMYQAIKAKNGLFIFTGPTGSGKTTSMYSILDKLALTEQKKVLTIENPIEIINDNFVQMQINEDMKITYSIGLKAALRQDPDVLMIGEIRDEETARNVFRAALTGHTVISTMHTKNKYGVVERLLDFGFLNSEIESILIGVSNQRLILDDNEKTKAFFDYVVGEDLAKMLSQKREIQTIDMRIDELKIKNRIK